MGSYSFFSSSIRFFRNREYFMRRASITLNSFSSLVLTSLNLFCGCFSEKLCILFFLVFIWVRQINNNQNAIQIKMHVSLLGFLPIFDEPLAWRASLMASSKTFLRPYWVRALHSRYLALCSSSIICRATSLRMGAFLGSFSFSRYSSRKSILFPTKIFIESLDTCYNSGSHFLRAFTKESGSITEKMIRKTSQWVYARTLSLLYSSCPAVSLNKQFNTIIPNWQVCYPLWRKLNSCRKWWEHTP